MDRCPGGWASCDTPFQYTIAIYARNIARAPISIRRTSIGHLYRVMPRQFGDGQHRQEAQHPPVTHGLLARKLYRAFARTVLKEERLTNASAALPSMDMPARPGCYDANRPEAVVGWLRKQTPRVTLNARHERWCKGAQRPLRRTLDGRVRRFSRPQPPTGDSVLASRARSQRPSGCLRYMVIR